MRQLHQRVCRTFHLRELSLKLTGQYIEHRLAVAGYDQPRQLFGPGAFERVHHHSEGIPRLINQICDNALLAAYTDSVKQVTATLIDEVVAQMMSLTEQGERRRPKGTLSRELVDNRSNAGMDRAESQEIRMTGSTGDLLRDLTERLSNSGRKLMEFEHRGQAVVVATATPSDSGAFASHA